MPVERAGGWRRLPRPQHPGGEDAVEQRLDQGRMEEARALVALEAGAERLFERGPHCRQRRCVARGVDTSEPVAGVGCEQPGQVLRIGQHRAVRQRADKILPEAGADLAGKGARCLQLADELVRAGRQTERLERRLAAGPVRTDQCKLAQVGHQHQVVAVPVARNLLAHGGRARVLVGRLHLDHATFRRLPLSRPALLHLLRGVEAEVWMARTLVGQLAQTEHLRLERGAHGVQQVRERPVARPFPGRPTRGAYPPEIAEVGLYRGRQCRVRAHHLLRSLRARPGRQIPPP